MKRIIKILGMDAVQIGRVRVPFSKAHLKKRGKRRLKSKSVTARSRNYQSLVQEWRDPLCRSRLVQPRFNHLVELPILRMNLK